MWSFVIVRGPNPLDVVSSLEIHILGENLNDVFSYNSYSKSLASML